MSAYRLFPCPSCQRHVQPAASSCPFCKHPLMQKVSPEKPQTLEPIVRDRREMRMMYGSPAVMRRAMEEESEQRARAQKEERRRFELEQKLILHNTLPSDVSPGRCSFVKALLPGLLVMGVLGLLGYLLFWGLSGVLFY